MPQDNRPLAERAMELLRRNAVPELPQHIQYDMDHGIGEWIWDPEVDDVAGFKIKESEQHSFSTIVCIVYFNDADFEARDEYTWAWKDPS